jgi:hypothetical protein
MHHQQLLKAFRTLRHSLGDPHITPYINQRERLPRGSRAG